MHGRNPDHPSAGSPLSPASPRCNTPSCRIARVGWAHVHAAIRVATRALGCRSATVTICNSASLCAVRARGAPTICDGKELPFSDALLISPRYGSSRRGWAARYGLTVSGDHDDLHADRVIGALCPRVRGRERDLMLLGGKCDEGVIDGAACDVQAAERVRQFPGPRPA